MQLKRKGDIGMVQSKMLMKLLLCVMITLCLLVPIKSQQMRQVVQQQQSSQQVMVVSQQQSIIQQDLLISVSNNPSAPNCTYKCQTMHHYNCSICYQQCTYSNTTVVQLASCEWSYCNWWQNFVYSEDNPTSTYTRCTDYQTKLLPMEKCIATCCGNPSYNIFTTSTVQQCISANSINANTDSTVNIVIATSLSASFILIILTVILCWCRHKVIVCFDNFVYSLKNLCPCTRQHDKKQSKDSTTDATKTGSVPARSRRKWKLLKKKVIDAGLSSSKQMVNSHSDVNPQLYCSICLDDGLNCITSCQHRYHFQCLRTSLSKKERCPQCRGKSFNPLKIICQFCKQKYTSFKIDGDNIDERHPDFFYDGKIYCNECLEVHLTRGRRSHRRGNNIK